MQGQGLSAGMALVWGGLSAGGASQGWAWGKLHCWTHTHWRWPTRPSEGDEPTWAEKQSQPLPWGL